MDNDVKTWLFDIHNSILEIESFFIDIPRDFNYYQRDIRTKRAVERNLEIIGGAMSCILKQSDTIEISNSRKIVDVRNRIIHGYDSVSDETVWEIIIKQIPLLKTEVEELLK